MARRDSLVPGGPAVLLAMVSAAASSCLSYETSLTEFDSVTQLDAAEGEPAELVYRDDPSRYPWLFRQLQGSAFDSLLKKVLTVEATPGKVENPVGFARERLEVLAAKTGSDIHRIADSSVRLMWVAQFDHDQPLNQVVAVQGIANMIERLDLDVLDVPAVDPAVPTPAEIGQWLEVVQNFWPSERQQRLNDEQRQAYVGAVAKLTANPLPKGADQRALIRALDRGLELERDHLIAADLDAGLRRAMGHALRLALRNSLFSPSARVREAGVRGFCRLGGPPAVPYVMTALAKPSSIASRASNRFDEDPLVRLSLVRFCGQLSQAQASSSYQGGVAPIEFLYETAVSDDELGLRRIALEALAHTLGRDVSFDPQWAQKWWSEEYVATGATDVSS